MWSLLKKIIILLILGNSLIVFAKNKEVTIWIIGDSLFQTYKPSLAPLAGIGQMLQPFCKPNVKVKNCAKGGTSTKSFRESGYWEKVIKEIKKGDYLLIQFGHNDQKKSSIKRYAEAKTAYRNNLSEFIKETKAKEANPVLITSMCRRRFKKDKLVHTLRDYPKYCRLVAKEQNVPLIDLNKISFTQIGVMGKEKSKELYNHIPEGSKYTYWTINKGKKSHKDNTHLNLYGAKIVAGWLVDDAKKQQLELAKLFK